MITCHVTCVNVIATTGWRESEVAQRDFLCFDATGLCPCRQFTENFLFKYLNANFNFSWVGKRSRNEGDTRGDLDPQTLLDLCLIAKGFCNSLEILGSVHNVLDEDYRDPSVTDIPNDLPTNKRMFMVEVKYRF